MIGNILALLGELEDVLDEGGNGLKARSVIAEISRELAEKFTIDGSLITVNDDHESYAIEAVTAYLDGASRGDGFELLGETVARVWEESGGGVEWVVGVVAALSRLAGDLSVMAAARDGRSDWEGALEIIQQFASPGTEK